MSGKIKVEGDRIFLTLPGSSLMYVLELRDNDDVTVTVRAGGTILSTAHFPVQLIPYLTVFLKKNRERQCQFIHTEKRLGIPAVVH